MIIIYALMYILMVLLTIGVLCFCAEYFDVTSHNSEHIPLIAVLGIFWPLTLPIAICIVFAVFCCAKSKEIIAILNKKEE